MGYEAKILAIAKRIYNSFKFEQSEERIAMTELTKAYKEKINGYISKEKIREKTKELDQELEEVILNGDICYKDRELFENNVNFTKKIFRELLGE